MVLAIVADLVPAESFGVARIVGERPHREHGAHGGIETVDGVGVRLAALFKDDARRFNGPEPMQTPAGCGHGLDLRVLVGSGWFEFGDEGTEGVR